MLRKVSLACALLALGDGRQHRSGVLRPCRGVPRQGDRAEMTAGGRPFLSQGETSIMSSRLLSKIDEVLRLPHLSDFHTVEVRAIAERIESLFLSIRDTVDDRHYELLTATVDRLHREVALGEAALDRLLKSTGSL